jgi:hypothetical protein
LKKEKVTPGGGQTNLNPSLRVSTKDIIDHLNAVVRYDRAILAPIQEVGEQPLRFPEAIVSPTV